MRYTTEDGGRLNNFAVEPKMYTAEPATPTQKRSYWILVSLGTLLVLGLMFTAFKISTP